MHEQDNSSIEQFLAGLDLSGIGEEAQTPHTSEYPSDNVLYYLGEKEPDVFSYSIDVSFKEFRNTVDIRSQSDPAILLQFDSNVDNLEAQDTLLAVESIVCATYPGVTCDPYVTLLINGNERTLDLRSGFNAAIYISALASETPPSSVSFFIPQERLSEQKHSKNPPFRYNFIKTKTGVSESFQLLHSSALRASPYLANMLLKRHRGYTNYSSESDNNELARAIRQSCKNHPAKPTGW